MNDRQKKIIEYLKNNSENVSTKDISDKFNVSRRTVFSDLNFIEQYLKNTAYELIRNDGKGLSIIKSDECSIRFLNVNDLFKNNRKLLILKLVLFEGNYNIDSLADYLYISNSTLVNDINFINEFLLNGEKDQLIIKENVVCLSENNYNSKRIYVKFNELIYNDITQSVIQQELIYNYYYDILKQIYSTELVDTVKETLYEFLKENYETIAEYYLDNIISNLIVLIYNKLRNDEAVSYIDSHLESDIVPTEIDEVIQKIETKFDIKFNQREILFIVDLLKGNKFVPTIYGNYDNIIKIFINQLSEILDVNLNNDKVLFGQLSKHFPPLMYRLSNDIQINNPFIFDIKREYLTLFNAVWMVVMYNQEEFKHSINDNEIGLLTIYIQSALDRNKVSKKIVLINTTKMMNSDFISSRVKSVLPNTYIDIIEEDDRNFILNNNFDLIITTNDNKYNAAPTVNISPIVSDTDLMNISKKFTQTIFRNNSYRNINTENDINYIVCKYFRKELTYLNQKLKSKSEVFDFANKVLVEKDIVDNSYIDSVLAREFQGSTEVNNLVATPHGNPNYVKKNCVLTIANDEAMNWSEDKVQLIFLISVTKNDMKDLKDLFNFIYGISNDKKVISDILNTSTFEEFISILLGYRETNDD